MQSELVERSLAVHRRDKLFKPARGIVLFITFIIILVLVGFWNIRSEFLLGASNGPVVINHSTPPVFDTASDHLVYSESQPHGFAAQEIFGDHVRANSLWPMSNNGRPRFAYVLYATQKEYLCNAVTG